ncbi:Translocation protein S66 [Savitreella phatthalungensis]
MVSVFVPILYLAVLITSLATFSYYYRKRRLALESGVQMERWFPPHHARDIYFSLLASIGDEVDAEKAEVASLSAQEQLQRQQTRTTPSKTQLLKSALLLRAYEDIKRLNELNIRKGALHNLVQRGGCSDDLWRRMLVVEDEMKQELLDVVTEAGAIQEGWGQIIFATANEMQLNNDVRERLEGLVPLAVKTRQEFVDGAEAREARQKKAAARKAARQAAEREGKQVELERAQKQADKVAEELIAEAAQTQTTSAKGSPGSAKKRRK